MKPVNNKSLMHFLFEKMEQLDAGEISIEKAKTQASLAKQATEIVKLEHDRTRLVLEVDRHNRQSGTDYSIRNLEAINFD